MNHGSSDTAGNPEAAPAGFGENARTTMVRERFRKSQVMAAHAAPARSAGGAPSESEAARLVAEFHARSGQVSFCPPAGETASGAGQAGTETGWPATAWGRQDRKPRASE
jgi:hypothetical protein